MVKTVTKYLLPALCLLALAFCAPQAKASTTDFACSGLSNCNDNIALTSNGFATAGSGISVTVTGKAFGLPLGDGDEGAESFLLSFNVNTNGNGSGTINITDATDNDANLSGSINFVTIGGGSSSAVITMDVTWTMPSGYSSDGTVKVVLNQNAISVNNVDVSVLPSPEPASLLLLGTGLLGMGAVIRRRMIG